MIQGVAAKWSFSSLSAKVSVTSWIPTSYADFLYIHRTNYGRFWIYVGRTSLEVLKNVQ